VRVNQNANKLIVKTQERDYEVTLT
jgi:hypothetical protein